MTNISQNLYLIFILVSCSLCLETKLQNVVDLNDILSSSYMPGTFLMLEQLPTGQDQESNGTLSDTKKKEIPFDGSINKALDTMKFHRSMMNQYMCRSYVADQILSEINHTKFKKRMGQAPPITMQEKPLYADKLKNHLMLDEGSSSYQNWLSKSATLEDIYQNHNNVENRDDVYLENEADEEEEKNNDNLENYDGHVNDYTKQTTGKAVKIGHRGQNGGIYYIGGGNYYPIHHGISENLNYGSGGHPVEPLMVYDDGHAIQHEPITNNHPTKHYVHYTDHKADELADIFEIALTALAYLSFGMFIVHLIMSISVVKNNATTSASMMMPMNMSPTATATGTDATASGTATGTAEGTDTFKFRLRRETPKLTSPNNVALNEMAKRILNSIDSALVAYTDDGQCLQKSLCISNKYSRSLSGPNKLFLPVWSVGMSWLSGILTKNVSSQSRIDGLKAALLGLGRANCEIIYQKCDLKKAKHLAKQRK